MAQNNALNNRSSTFTVDNLLTVSTGNIEISGGTGSAATNPIINFGPSNNHISFIYNSVFIGSNAGNTTLTPGVAIFNIGIGPNASQSLTTGQRNTAVGNATLQDNTQGENNCAYGYTALTNLTSGNRNIGIGAEAFDGGGGAGLLTGNDNIGIGYRAGNAFTAGESNNICIANVGVAGNNTTIRIGTNGTHTRAFIAGIDGVNVGSVVKVVTLASDQLGTANITAGTGITVTPGANTITISGSGTTTLNYTNVNTTPYVVTATDNFLGVDCSGGAITVQLPNAPATGRTFVIKDRTGSANTFAITVTTVGGAVNIDGATSYTMNTQYAAISLLFDGSTYQIY